MRAKQYNTVDCISLVSGPAISEVIRTGVGPELPIAHRTHVLDIFVIDESSLSCGFHFGSTSDICCLQLLHT
jgi:hypothetical protein